MDYLITLKISQIRTLFDIISRLVVESSKEDSQNSFINDDLYIVIRKQLSSRDFKFKRIGIVGGMSLLKNITQFSTNTSVLTSPENQVHLEDDVVKQVGFFNSDSEIFSHTQYFLSDHYLMKCFCFCKRVKYLRNSLKLILYKI